MSTYAVIIASRLIGELRPFLKVNQLGEVVGEMLFGLDPPGKLRRRPDVAFVSYKRWPKGRAWPHTDPWPVVPDLAVEVVSPNDLAEDLRIKVSEYFKAGVQQVWIVYPKLALVDVYESATAMRVHGRTDELDGGSILPGLRLPVASLFEAEAESTAKE